MTIAPTALTLLPRETRASHRPGGPAPRPSFAQERLWLLNQFEPGLATDNRPLAFRLRGRLDPARLERCLVVVAGRHRVLRTAFPVDQGRPVLAAAEAPRLRLRDLTSISAGRREASAARLAAADAGRPFDLARGPMLRALLLRLSAQDHVLVVTTHHIVADGWSDAVFWREASLFYDAFGAGRGAAPDEPPMQYADFSAWQRARLTGPRLARELEHWRGRLAGATRTELPTDRPGQPLPSGASARLEADLPQHLTSSLARLARRQGASPFMVLLAACQALLCRYLGEDDVVVGVPVAGRTHPGCESVVGPFVNLLAVRGDLSGDPRFSEVVARTRGRLLEALEHQELPFEKLVEELGRGRRGTRSPLFQVAFNWRNFEPARFAPAGLACEPFEIPSHQARFDLALEGSPVAGTTRLRVEWRTDLFDPATVRAFVESYRVLLEGVAADPDCRLSNLPLLTVCERRRLAPTSPSPVRAESRDEGALDIATLLREQARARPRDTAFAWGDERLSFADLEERSRAVAGRLRAMGVARQTPVALYAGRTLAAVAGVLGILRSGAAYVPLERSSPPERLRLVLEEAKARAIVTDCEALRGAGPPLLRVDAPAGDAVAADERRDATPRASDPAYVIYTSGSTGRPKGVVATHGALSNRLRWMWRVHPFGADETAAVRTPFNFVDSLWEILGAALQGRPAVVVPDDVGRDPGALVVALAAHHVTRLWLLPSLLRALIDRFPDLGPRLPELRFWVASGEALPPDLLAVFRAAVPGASLYNLYGTSEVWDATWHETVAEDVGRARVPVGRPIDRVRAYVLDRWMNPLPVGARGELYVGGAGVALGYTGRADLTAARFVPDPFGEGTRLSRTGDLARWLPDGGIDLLGRADAQIKLRGYRIEPAEIELALAAHPGVREAAVAARGPVGGTRLLCWLVPRGAPPSDGDLRSFLRRRLPSYMIPARFVAVDALPTTPSGKLDRQRLPDPVDRLPAVPHSGPSDSLEARLTAIFQRTLRLPEVGTEDDFFELGGHSLLALELFGRIEREVGRALPLATLLEAPTVASLAERLRREAWDGPRAALVSIQPGGDRVPLFCVHGIGGGVLGYRPLARLLGADQPVYGLQHADRQRPGRFRIEAIASHYVDEVRSILPHGPYVLAGLSLGGVVALEMARQLRERGEDVPFLGLFDSRAPGYPRYLPPWRHAAAHLTNFVRLSASERRHYMGIRLQALRPFVRLRLSTALRGVATALGRPSPVAAFALEGPYLWALREYAPQPYTGPITLFRARQQPVGCAPDPTNGWARLARGGLEVHEVPGEHATLIAEPHVRAWASILRSRLDSATAPGRR